MLNKVPINVPPVIEITGLTKRYAGSFALKNVGLVVPTGVTGLLGPNGSGKSTFIKAVLGLVKVDSGSGTVLGNLWPKRVKSIRDQIGYLPEDDCYILGLQGVESVQMMARLSGLPSTEALRRAHEVLDFCDVGQERYRNVETYSTGMRQKLKFAQALVHDPQLIILDEPTTGLDPTQREEFLDRIHALAHRFEKTILLSTHILHDVQQVCAHVIILVRGQVMLADSLANMQRPIQSGIQIRVVCAAVRLAQSLRLKGLNVHCHNDTDLLVQGESPAIKEIVWATSRSEGVLVERMDEARNSLEHSFLKIVSEKNYAYT
ncbi:MAG TPA: ABC transporter ATP-binding protein [Pirellula sp.]|nr:ABC transporter ATP-binding protein [Pirellula sp.]